jgi:acylphosphatase
MPVNLRCVVPVRCIRSGAGLLFGLNARGPPGNDPGRRAFIEAGENDMAYVQAIVQGRVQGVGFRWFAQRAAQKLGLKGYVRNLANGDVEVVAVGERETLEALVAQLRRGPGFSYVTDVRCEWADEGPDFKGFQIAF